MSPTLKRILFIAALLIAAGLVAWGLYAAFRRAAPRPIPLPPPVGAPTPPGQLPSAGVRVPPGAVITPPTEVPPAGEIPPLPPTPAFERPAAEQVTSDLALFPSINPAGELRYHNGSDGRFYRLTPDGQVELLTDQVFFSVSKVTWADRQDKAVLEYPDGAKIIYNFETKRQVTLPSHWQDFSWSPDGAEVAAKSLGLSPENRWLVVTKEDGTGTRLIEPLGEYADRVRVDWSPSRQTVALSQTGEPLGLDRREVLFVGLNGENFKSTVVEGLDFVAQWSPTGQKLLYSVDSARSNFKPELWVVDAYGDSIGNNRRNLGLNTWATKCTFGQDSVLFCAVPRDLPTGAGMAPEIAAGSFDDLYKIDLKTGLKIPIPLGGDYRLNNISYDTARSTLFFTDSTRSGVFEIQL